MKNYLPVLIFIAVFSTFLSLQVGKEYFGVEARSVNISESVKAHLESVFAQSTFFDQNNLEIDLSKNLNLIVFWATWCAPCKQELTDLSNFNSKFPSLNIVAVNLDDEDQLSSIQKFLGNNEVKFKIAIGGEEDASQYKVDSLPYSVLFYKGKLVQEFTGNSETFIQELELAIQNLN